LPRESIGSLELNQIELLRKSKQKKYLNHQNYNYLNKNKRFLENNSSQFNYKTIKHHHKELLKMNEQNKSDSRSNFSGTQIEQKTNDTSIFKSLYNQGK
jgi:hypothetical protein